MTYLLKEISYAICITYFPTIPYFNFAGKQLADIARNAAELGVELFVLDDGWLGKCDDDNSGLGDWFPNEKKWDVH